MSRRGSEDLLIQRIARAVPTGRGFRGRDHGIVLGIGDDAAVLASSRDNEWVVSCDAFIEGVHFLADVHPADSVGYKALARATSDLVAMGAEPRLFLLTLSVPTKRTGGWLDRFLKGLGRAARSLDMHLAGGDTTAGATVAINVTVLGEIDRNRGRLPRRPRSALYRGQALTRSGAQPGDRIYVSGTLGRAQLGLELVRKGYVNRRSLASSLRPHLYPRLRVQLGRWLARSGTASAMMDLSDGLSSDLARLCRASQVGAALFTSQIPTVSVTPKLSKLLRGHATPLEMALHGGDDYELLFAVPERNEKRLRAASDFRALSCIGEITGDQGVRLVHADGHATPLKPAGWDPFR
jgi:thiamine-monophosphate kinase